MSHNPLDPNYLALSCKICFQVIELQDKLIKLLKNKPDDRITIDSLESTIRELKRTIFT